MIRSSRSRPPDRTPDAGCCPAAPDGVWLPALRRYVLATAFGHLAWEFAHMPLYTLWIEGDARQIAFAALHCTGGDILIAAAALLAALLVAGGGGWPAERRAAVAALTVAAGLAYTVFSEWLNIVRRAAWAYSAWMPVIPLGGFDIGLSPLAQWTVVPSVALWLARPLAARGRTHWT